MRILIEPCGFDDKVMNIIKVFQFDYKNNLFKLWLLPM